LGHLKWPYFENYLSVRAEILCGILEKIILGLEGNKFFKKAQKAEFLFYTQKTAKNTSFWPLKTAIP
jgi:hypothetical protein